MQIWPAKAARLGTDVPLGSIFEHYSTPHMCVCGSAGICDVGSQPPDDVQPTAEARAAQTRHRRPRTGFCPGASRLQLLPLSCQWAGRASVTRLHRAVSACMHSAWCRMQGPRSQVTIFDASNKQLPPGKIGEVCIRGPNVTKGYLNRPEANKEAYAGMPAAPELEHEFVMVKRVFDSPPAATRNCCRSCPTGSFSRTCAASMTTRPTSSSGTKYTSPYCHRRRVVPHGRPGLPGRRGLPDADRADQGAHQPRRREDLAH